VAISVVDVKDGGWCHVAIVPRNNRGCNLTIKKFLKPTLKPIDKATGALYNISRYIEIERDMS